MQAPTNTCKITQVISYRRKSKHPAGFSKMTLADVLWQTVMKHLTLSFTLSRRLVLTGKIISFWQVEICGQHLGWHSSFERFHTTTLLSVQFNPTPPPWYPQTISFMLTYKAPILGALVYLHVYMSKSGDHTAQVCSGLFEKKKLSPEVTTRAVGRTGTFTVSSLVGLRLWELR